MGREKTDTTEKNTPGGCGWKRATAADRRVVALKAVLAESKSAHAQPVDISAQSEADTIKAPADFESTKICLAKV